MEKPIQIIGLRPYIDQKTNKEKMRHELFGTIPNINELLSNLDGVIELIPQNERYNVYFTALNCLEPSKHGGSLRRFKSQENVPLDIDHIDPKRIEEYVSVIGEVLSLDMSKVGQVFTGNGLQFHIRLERAFEDVSFFELKRLQYKAMCSRINEALTKANLPGGADPAVWSSARLLRLPNTENRKPKGVTQAKLLNATFENSGFDWEKASGVPELTVADHLAEWNDKKAPKLDNKAIFSGCDFIKWIQTQPEQVREPHFYAALSIVGRMKEGRTTAHQIQSEIRASGSDSSVAFMDAKQVENKIDQAIQASGPRTCKNINTIWGKCAECPNFNKLTSPVSLKSPDFIATLETGFYKTTKRNGKVPAFDDLLKYFDNLHKYKTLDQNGMVFVWNGTHYIEFTDTMIKNFAVETFKPLAKQSYINEFASLVSESNLIDKDFFNNHAGFINLRNGILNIKNGTLSPHDPQKGFRYVLPYDYDPCAKAIRFDKFLDEVTGGDTELRKVIEEFAGYVLSGDTYWLHKCLLLVGEGKNGKSKLLNAIRYVVGEDNYSALSLNALIESQNNRQLLEGKLLNFASEMSHRDMRDTDIFKRLTEGGVIDVKKMYYQPYQIENRAKLIFACNVLPDSTDQSYGFLRRMLIIPFKQTFEGVADDPFIDEKFKSELSGIFNIFLAGYQRLSKQGEFTVSNTSEAALLEYKQINNPVEDFLNEFSGVTVNPLIPIKTFVSLNSLYKAFCSFNQTEVIGDSKYGRIGIKLFAKYLKRTLPDGEKRADRLRGLGPEKVSVVYNVELTLDGGEKTYIYNENGKHCLRGSDSIKV